MTHHERGEWIVQVPGSHEPVHVVAPVVSVRAGRVGVEPRGGAGLPVPRAPRRAHERALERGRRGAALRIVGQLLLDGNPLVSHRELRGGAGRGMEG